MQELPPLPLPGEARARTAIQREIRAAVWKRDGGRCRNCGITDAEVTADTGVRLHYDHIIPFSKNGADTVNNIQLLCEACNLSNGNRQEQPKTQERVQDPRIVGEQRLAMEEQRQAMEQEHEAWFVEEMKRQATPRQPRSGIAGPQKARERRKAAFRDARDRRSG
jgi:hypothetical protein